MVIENKVINISDNKLNVNLANSIEYFLNKIDETANKNSNYREKINLQVKFLDKETLRTEITENQLREVTKISNK